MKKVMLLLSNGFEALEASVFTDIFGWNNDEVGEYPIELITVGLRERIKCTWNFTVIPEKLLSEVNINEFDALAIPGGYEEAGFYEEAYGQKFLNVIREFDKAKKPICAICVGSLPLAKSGILKGRKAITYHLNYRKDQFASYGVDVAEELLVVDDNVITCSGPANAMDASFKFLEMMTSAENVKKIRKLMCY